MLTADAADFGDAAQTAHDLRQMNAIRNLDGEVAVSYTHLDVYKRQPIE